MDFTVKNEKEFIMPGKISLYVVAFISILSPTLIASDLGYKPGELIVRFSSKENGKQRTLAEQNEVLASINAGTIKHSYKLVPGLTLVKLQPDLSVEKVLPLLKNAGGILYAEPNYRIKALADFPDDPNFPQLWGMHNTGQTGGTGDADIDAPEAWNIATDSDIIVAVIDSGVDCGV
jgi:subtilisin family serine protease